MSDVTIYHNPRCSKSRQTLELLRENEVEPDIVEYLTAPPSRTELVRILGLLGIEAKDLMRAKEKVFGELGLSTGDDSDTLIDAMVANPILIERPIVVKGNRAAIGRPPEGVLAIL
jgi:arsenate reductase (glutaredoxin)